MYHTPLAPDKKRHLVFVYVTQGFTAAKPLAIEYGVSPRIMAKYTRLMGIKNKRGRQATRKKRRIIRPDRCQVAIDDRWQRAVTRGSI